MSVPEELARPLAQATAAVATEPNVVVVAFTLISREGEVLSVIAEALDLRSGTGADSRVQSREAWIAQNAPVGPTPLVFYNCEHLIDSIANLAAFLLTAKPNLRIMATSRRPLAITGEAVLEIPELPLPSALALMGTGTLLMHEALPIVEKVDLEILGQYCEELPGEKSG